MTNWAKTTIGKLEAAVLLELRPGFAEGAHNVEGRGVPHLRPFNVTSDGRIDFDRVKYVAPPPDNSPHWLRPRDIIFNNTNSEDLTGKTALFDLDIRCVPSNHMTVLRTTLNGSPDAYWLAARLRYLWKTGFFKSILRRYVGQASVSLTRLRSVEIEVPPLSEQRMIAHVLRTVQRAKEATEQVIAAARELKKSMMRHLFTYGPVAPDVAGRTALRDTDSLAVRSDWKTASLEDSAEWLSGGTPSTTNPDYWGGDIPWVSSSNLTTFRLGDSDRRVTALGAKNGTRVVPKDTILVVVRGMSLRKEWRVAITTRNVAFGQDCKALRPKPGFDPVYFAYAVKAQEPVVLTMVDRSGHGTGRLSTDRLRSVEIPAISLDDQRTIAAVLCGIDSKIAAEEARRDALAALFDSLLHDLMTARLRVTDLEIPA